MDTKKFKDVDELFQTIGSDSNKRNNLLEHIKRNPYLKDDLLQKTNYLDNQYLVQPLSQRIYHYTHGMHHGVPTHPLGWYVRFKNFDEGYIYSKFQTVRNCEWHKLSAEEIRSYVLTTSGGMKHPILQKWIKEQTSFLDPFNATIKLRLFYFRQNLTYPIIDYKTGKLAYLFSEKQVKKYCFEIEYFENLTDNEKKEYFRNLLSLKDRERMTKSQLIRFCPQIVSYLENKTKHLNNLNFSKNITMMAWHVVNNIQQYPSCRVCNKEILPKQFNNGYLKYPLTCGHECNNKCIEIIEKRLKNNNTNDKGYYTTNVGENEKYLLTLISRIKKLNIVPNKRIGPFFIDGYVPDKKLVIEVQETRHAYNKQFEKDKRKIGYLLKNGYKILMILDNWFGTKVKCSRFQKAYKEYFEGMPDVDMINIQTINGKILSDIGWSNAMSVQKTKTDVQTLTITTNAGKQITCTEDHLIYSNEEYYKPAKEFVKGNYIYTVNGKEKVKSVEFCREARDVFDVIETENNTFFANEIKVHNCICLDEAAFIDCLKGNTIMSLKNSKGQIFKSNIKDIFDKL